MHLPVGSKHRDVLLINERSNFLQEQLGESSLSSSRSRRCSSNNFSDKICYEKIKHKTSVITPGLNYTENIVKLLPIMPFCRVTLLLAQEKGMFVTVRKCYFNPSAHLLSSQNLQPRCALEQN